MAIAYDFDGTLAPGNMQEHDFIPDLNIKPAEFWKEAKKHAREHDMDEILAYMELMLHEVNHASTNIKIFKRNFKKYGKELKLFKGLKNWFNRINEYGKTRGVKVEHYIISSGLREMIAGTEIKKYIKKIFASGFRYDQHNVAKKPALAVNYTNKTQYLFRINKGILNSWDNSEINKYTPDSKRPIPFSNIVYIGDGETDIPAMKLVKYKGGYSIAVYNPDKRGAKAKIEKLVNPDRCHCVLPADYTKSSKLDKSIKSIIEQIASRDKLDKYRIK